MPKLSVIVLAKNEERNIRECLERVKWADEAGVIDECSKEKAVEIAAAYTDKIYTNKMEGFGRQRNFGIEKASGDWIYFVDADDRVTDELKDEVQSTIQDPQYDAYQIYQRSNYLGKWINHCGWYSPVMKLLKKGSARYSEDKAVERPVTDGEFGYLKNPVDHLGYPDLNTHLRKFVLYTEYEADTIVNKGVEFRWFNIPWYFIVKPVCKFFYKYLLQQGFRDGVHGLILCMMSAVYMFMVYAAAWEKTKKNT